MEFRPFQTDVGLLDGSIPRYFLDPGWMKTPHCDAFVEDTFMASLQRNRDRVIFLIGRFSGLGAIIRIWDGHHAGRVVTRMTEGTLESLLHGRERPDVLVSMESTPSGYKTIMPVACVMPADEETVLATARATALSHGAELILHEGRILLSAGLRRSSSMRLIEEHQAIRQLLEISDDCHPADLFGWRPRFELACRRYDLIQNMIPDDRIRDTLSTVSDASGFAGSV